MPTVRTQDATELYWDSIGSGDPLLFIAGQAMSHRGWMHVAPQYADQFRVIVFDHRGIGDSEAGGTTPYSTELFAQDCVSILEAAGESSAHVYGHSMGGRIAQQLALQHPQRIRKLVLGATTPGDSRGEQRSKEARDDLYSGKWRRLAPHFFSQQFIDTQPELAKAFFATRAEISTLRQHYLASTNHDTWSRLSEITAPTLVIHGEKDNLTPVSNARLMAEGIPGATLEVLPQGLHGYFYEDPHTNELVKRFLLR